MAPGQPPAGPSAVKIGGFALIGVGALAAVFGVATAVSGEPDSAAKGPRGVVEGPRSSAASQGPTSSRVEEPGASTSATPPPEPSGSAGSSAETSRPGTPGGSGAHGQVGREPSGGGQVAGRQPGGQGGQGGQGGGSGTRRQIVLRVYNNSTIRGLAHRAAEDFRAAGYRVAEIGNYSAGRIPVTTIYYRPGTAEQAQARIVAERFGARVEPRFPGIRHASPGVIAIVTKNYDGPETGK